METTVKLYTTGYTEMRTYLLAALFVSGNIVLPQLFHLMPQGGMIWVAYLFLYFDRRL